MADVAGSGGTGGDGVGGVGGYKGAGEELGTKEGEVGVHGEDLGLSVKMVDSGHLHAPRGYSEGVILEGLEPTNGSGGCVGEPGGGGVSEQGTD